MPGKRFQVLVVEDSKPDADLLAILFQQVQIPIDLHLVHDGQQAIDFLFQRDSYANAPVPDLVLLDLNLPKKDGRQVLKELKSADDRKRVPVLMLSTSNNEDDVSNAYDLGASGFVSKPVGLDEYQRMVNVVCDYWFSCLRLVSSQPLKTGTVRA